MSLAGKTALVTGGSRGIGKAIALGLADAGADVAVCDMELEDDELKAVAQQIKKLGRRTLANKCDVTKSSQVDRMIERVESTLGPVGILVNNAGIGGGARLMDVSNEEWDRYIATDLTSVFYCSRAVGMRMKERHQGVIISIASAAGLRGFSERNTYNVAKAGVIMLTRVMARDWARFGIRAVALAPTYVKTEMIARLGEKALADEAARIPLGRLAEPEDLASAAVFLASDAASYISGDTLILDGAQLA